jgi:hypothetical protein
VERHGLRQPLPLTQPLTTAAQAGGISRLLSTIQQVAGAAGVALIGLLFFHSAASGTPPASTHGFELSLGALAVVLVGVAATARRLPR